MNYQKLKELVHAGVNLAPDTVLELIEQAQRAQPSTSSSISNFLINSPPPPEHPETTHYGHELGQWYWACCACPNAMHDPNCAYCTGKS